MIEVRVPGDKSISHRALMLAALASGTSRITGLATGADVRSTAGAMRLLGVGVPDLGTSPTVEIAGVPRLRPAPAVIDCGNSGTAARLLIGLLSGEGQRATIDGDASLRGRPMDRVVAPLAAAGGRFEELGEPGRLPVRLAGGRLSAIDHRSPVASAQVKSALLLAGLGAGVEVRVSEPSLSRDHTERMLRAMGAEVESERGPDGEWVRLVPPRRLDPLLLDVPGDISSAAFWLGLAVLGGTGEPIRIVGVGLNPSRTGILDVLRAMGGSLEVRVTGQVAGEPVGSVSVESSELSGIDVPPEWIPRLLDEIPLIACLAAGAAGTTRIRGAGELRVKESDRLRSIAANLGALGVTCRERADGLEIVGQRRRLSGRVATGGDHRIAMAFAVLGGSGHRVELDDRDCVGVSYPGFWDELARLSSG